MSHTACIEYEYTEIEAYSIEFKAACTKEQVDGIQEALQDNGVEYEEFIHESAPLTTSAEEVEFTVTGTGNGYTAFGKQREIEKYIHEKYSDMHINTIIRGKLTEWVVL